MARSSDSALAAASATMSAKEDCAAVVAVASVVEGVGGAACWRWREEEMMRYCPIACMFHESHVSHMCHVSVMSLI